LAKHQRVFEIRIETASHLLLRGEKLKTIAAMTGFCDEYHLSKTFKQVTGRKPKNYKISV
jgi:transcriptional regulator GlxA family with amidase domain